MRKLFPLRLLRRFRRLLLAGTFSVALAAACATTGGFGAAAFRVECNVPDATVWVDDVLIGRASDWAAQGRHIRPGFHRVEIRHPTHYSHFAEVELAEGGTAVVKADLRPNLD